MSWSILPPMTELAEKAPTEMKGASYSENDQLGVGFARVPAKGGVPAPPPTPICTLARVPLSIEAGKKKPGCFTGLRPTIQNAHAT